MKEKKEQIIAQIETVNDMLNVICEELNELETINNLQFKIDKAIEYLVNNIDLENDDFTKINLGCDVLKILDLDKYNEFLKEDK